GDMSHCTLELVAAEPEPRCVTGCKLRKSGGRGAIRHPQVIHCTLCGHGQPTISSVLELLNTDSQSKVHRPGGDGVCSAAQCFSPGGAHVFYTGHRHSL